MAKNPNSGRKAKPPLEIAEAQRSLDMGKLGGVATDEMVFGIKGQGKQWRRNVASSDFGKLQRAAEKGYGAKVKRAEAKRRSPHGFRHMTAAEQIGRRGGAN
jgi:integrase